MKFGIYSIRDKLSGYMNIFLERSDVLAQRGFSTVVNDCGSAIYCNPGDYDLYKLGSFDTDSGVITANNPDFVCSASNLFNGVKEDK